MTLENKRILIYSFAVLISFFAWYLFAYRQYFIIKQEAISTPIYIDIKTNKKSIIIEESPENIYFRVNGNIIQSGSVDLKE